MSVEAKSQSWLTTTWRPLLMMVVISIIAVNYLVLPIIAIVYPEVMDNVLELPDQLWDLLTLGVSGYVVGRSGEKMVEKWSNSSKGKQE